MSEEWRFHHPIIHEIDGRETGEALRHAIEDICERMRPLSPEEERAPENLAYSLPRLDGDVALFIGGRLVAAVRALPDGPQVIRFGDPDWADSSVVVVRGRGAGQGYRRPDPSELGAPEYL